MNVNATLTSLYLQWYRDQGNGQQAADATGAEQRNDGSWPVARLHIPNDDNARTVADRAWTNLLKVHQVNATLYSHYRSL